MPRASNREKFAVQIFLKSISQFIFTHVQIDKYFKQDFNTCAWVILLLLKSLGISLLPSVFIAGCCFSVFFYVSDSYFSVL